MPRIDDILRFMRSRRVGVGICDECIAKNLNLMPIQSVNSELIHLIALGKVRSAKTQCHCCGKTRQCFVLRT